MITDSNLQKPWLNNNAYKAINLQERDDFRTNNGKRLTLSPNLLHPIYFELGKNVVSMIGGQLDLIHAYTFRNLTAKTDDAVMEVTYRYPQPYIILGRETSPALQLDASASRRHLEFRPMLSQLDIIDLKSTNGTIAHTMVNPQTHTIMDPIAFA